MTKLKKTKNRTVKKIKQPKKVKETVYVKVYDPGLSVKPVVNNFDKFASWLLVGLLIAFMGLIIFLTFVRPAKATYDGCSKVCVNSIPWCEKWQGFHCKEWGKKCLKHEWVCQTPEPTPTSTPTPTVVPEPTSTPVPYEHPIREAYEAQIPACADHTVPPVPLNPHVLRNGGTAIVKYVPTGGNLVDVYFKENGQSSWTHALGDQFNDGYLVIDQLKPELGYTFAIRQHQNCGAGHSVAALVVDPPANSWQVFKLTRFITL